MSPWRIFSFPTRVCWKRSFWHSSQWYNPPGEICVIPSPRVWEGPYNLLQMDSWWQLCWDVISVIMSHETVPSTLPPDSTLSLIDFEGAMVQRHSRGKKLRAASVNNPVKSFDLLSNVFQEKEPIKNHRHWEMGFSLVEPLHENFPLLLSFMAVL